MTAKERIEKLKVKLPSPAYSKFAKLAFTVATWGNQPEFHYHFDKDELKGEQVILIADHAATNTYMHVTRGYLPIGIANVVVGKLHFYVKSLHKLLIGFGCIPKNLFENDTKSTKMMLKVLKMGGNLCLFPEGIQSSSGSNHPIHPTTAKFLKSAVKTVVLCKSYGSYLQYPRYDENRRKGHHEYHYEILFTPSELKELSEEEVYRKMLERFRYNDFEWNLEKKYEYTSKDGNAENIDTILYVCPKCGSEFTLHTEGRQIVCDHCGNRINVADTYEITAADNSSIQPYRHIDEWYRSQRQAVRELVKDPNFSISYDCKLELIHTEQLKNPRNYIAGEGRLTIDHEKIHYEGTCVGADKGTYDGIFDEGRVELDFDITGVPCFINVPGKGNEFFYKGEFYMFDPTDDPRHSVKYMMIVEELHNLTDPKWNKACRDAYDRTI